MTDPTERNEADVAGLVERLRATWPKIKAGPVTTFQRNLIHEAAATLTTYAARIAELEAEVAARDEVLSLIAALGPKFTNSAPEIARAFLARNTDGGGK
jgi:phage tail tape-measure protein